MLKKEKKEVTEGSPLRSGRRLLGRETPAVGSQRLVHNPKEGIVTSLAREETTLRPVRRGRPFLRLRLVGLPPIHSFHQTDE